ncbi:MAG: hypothetical protein WBD74_00585 [Candidatus Aquilonibacter sp.]
MRHHGLAFVALFILALAACNGGNGGPYVVGVPGTPLPTASPTSPPPGSATVSFLVIVPPAGSARTRPKVVVPSNATSVKFTIDSVNGTAYNGTPTTETLGTSNSACQLTNGQLSCAFSLTAPVGTLVYTVTVYNGTSVIAEGNVSLTTTNGATVNAPLTLNGTVTKVVVSMGGTSEVGAAGSIPVVVDALDANGHTVLGTYTNPISLSDTDGSGQTSLSSTGPLSSSTTAQAVTLNYLGGAMASPATIAASASGVSGSNVTPATFLPDATAPTVNGATTTFAYSGTTQAGFDGPPSGATSPFSGTYTVTVATGQSFNGLNNLVEISGIAAAGYTPPTLGSPGNMCGGCYAYFGDVGPGFATLDDNFVSYFAWRSANGASILGYVGVNDPSNPATVTCASPYNQQLVLPFTATWNVLSGAGACTYSSVAAFGGGAQDDTSIFAPDGSYSDSYSIACCAGASLFYDFATQSSGVASMTYSSDFGDNGYIVTVPAVTSASSTIPITIQTFPSEQIPPPGTPGTPAPVATTVPNPWTVAVGLTGAPPSPLESDTFVSKGTITTLPSQCLIGGGILPASPTLSEADETIVFADPMADWSTLYSMQTIQHYYLAGVGEICNEDTANYVFPEGGSMLEWYDGVDQDWDTEAFSQWAYVTSTSLTAYLAHGRTMTQALPAAAAALQAASYVMSHLAMRVRPARHRPFVNHFPQRIH